MSVTDLLVAAEKRIDNLTETILELRAELNSKIEQNNKFLDMHIAEMKKAEAEMDKKDAALTNLFQACAFLPLEEMNRMEKEINAASKALSAHPAPQEDATDKKIWTCDFCEKSNSYLLMFCNFCGKHRSAIKAGDE